MNTVEPYQVRNEVARNVIFYPTALKGCRGFVFTHGVQMGARQKKVCPGCISETVRYRKFIHGRGCRCATS